jgi:hypothetical protein
VVRRILRLINPTPFFIVREPIKIAWWYLSADQTEVWRGAEMARGSRSIHIVGGGCCEVTEHAGNGRNTLARSRTDPRTIPCVYKRPNMLKVIAEER